MTAPFLSAEASAEVDSRLQDSLADQVLKAFALVAGTMNGASQARQDFITAFYGRLYPRDLSGRFLARYQRFLTALPGQAEIARVLKARLAPQERLFVLLVLYAFLAADEVGPEGMAVVRGLGDLMEVAPADAAYLERDFNLANPSALDMEGLSVVAVHVGEDPDQVDVHLPLPGLDLTLYRLQDIAVALKRGGDARVSVEGYGLAPGVPIRVSHNHTVRVGEYELRHHDLQAHFENKVHPNEAVVWIRQQELAPVFSDVPGPDNLVEIQVLASIIRLTTLDDGALVKVGDRVVAESETLLHLDDQVFVNGYRLNVRELFSAVNAFRGAILPAPGERMRIGNDIRANLPVFDDQPRVWTAWLEADYDDSLVFDPGDCPYRVFVDNKPARDRVRVGEGSAIELRGARLDVDIEAGEIIRRNFGLSRLVAKGLTFAFDDGTVGLDGVDLDVEYGDLVGIMGPSGSGKSTLLRVLSGLVHPDQGRVMVDERDMHTEFDRIKEYLGYVPQEDLLLSNLTVGENLAYYARLRFPDRPAHEVDSKVDRVLMDIGLADKRDLRVGDATDKVLSGGERKRLNIGLELIADAEVYLLDEPTSGLSSKDSEKIVDLLTELALRGKIVVAVIHQPGSRIYKKFNKILLLDKGGKVAYFGQSEAAVEYFKRHLEQSDMREPMNVECPRCGSVQPDVLLDGLEESLRDIDGSVLHRRQYTPDYWQQRYRDTAVDSWLTSITMPSPAVLPPRPRIGLSARMNQFRTLVARSMKSKLRDRSNLAITFLEAPLLGAGVGFILRYAPREPYTLYTNDLFPTFLFVAVIVAVFLSMTNSVSEIISDRALFLRERMVNMTHRGYLGAKLVTLLPFAFIQNLLFLVPGFLILQVRELYVEHLVFLTVVSFAALSAGLLVSSIPRLSVRAAQNMVPLVLVPQIILGGALIEYEKLNTSLTLVANSPVPEICQFMPSRWAYEGMVVLQELGNSYHARHTQLLDAVKEAKRALVDARGEDPDGSLTARKDRLEAELAEFRDKYKYAYGNKRMHDAVQLGRAQYDDLLEEQLGEKPSALGSAAQDLKTAYPLFTPIKRLPVVDVWVSSVVYDGLVLILMGLVFNIVSLGLLRDQEGITRLGRRLTGLFRRRRAKE